jgi:hypothetical protein
VQRIGYLGDGGDDTDADEKEASCAVGPSASAEMRRAPGGVAVGFEEGVQRLGSSTFSNHNMSLDGGGAAGWRSLTGGRAPVSGGGGGSSSRDDGASRYARALHVGGLLVAHMEAAEAARTGPGVQFVAGWPPAPPAMPLLRLMDGRDSLRRSD